MHRRSLALVAAATLSLIACASSDDASGTDARALSQTRDNLRQRLEDLRLRKQTDVDGIAIATQSTDHEGKITSEVSAWFGTKYRGPLPTCTTEKFGDYCEVESCPSRPPPSVAVSVGNVHLESALQRVELSPGDDNTYQTKKLEGALWSPGAMLTWTLSGNPPGVPSELLRQQAPVPITVGEPGEEIDSTKDYSISWTSNQPGRGAQVGVFLFAFAGEIGRSPTSVMCNVPAEVGHVSIPAAAIAKLPPGMTELAVQEETTSHVVRARQDYVFQALGARWSKEVTVK